MHVGAAEEFELELVLELELELELELLHPPSVTVKLPVSQLELEAPPVTAQYNSYGTFPHKPALVA